MHTLEPFYNWRHIYISEEDSRSPFFGIQHSEFDFTSTIYNYYIHPQWDDFGSRTLYVKVLMADYEENYVIMELIGEWNDAIENDIMEFKREVIEPFMVQGIFKFVVIAENVFNFHSDTTDYYEELEEEIADNNGWFICLNMPQQSLGQMRQTHIDRYILFTELESWRNYKPFHLFKKMNEYAHSLLD